MSPQENHTSIVTDEVPVTSHAAPTDLVKSIIGEDLAIAANVALMLNALETNNASTISFDFQIYDGAFENPDVSTDLDDDEKLISIYVNEENFDNEGEKFVLTEMEIHEAMAKISRQFIQLADGEVSGGELVITTESGQGVLRSYHYEESSEEVESNGGFSGPLYDDGHIVASVFGITSSREAQAYNLQTLLDSLKKAGCTFYKLQYAGSGDSGDRWEIDHNIADMERRVQIVDAKRSWNGQHYETRFEVKSSPIEDVAEAIMQNYLQVHHSGYEDSNGGGGEVELVIRNGEINWNGYSNTEVRVDDEPITISPVDLQLVQRKQTSVKP